MSNRILVAFANADKAIKAKLDSGEVSSEAVDKCSDSLNMSASEHADLQTRKSALIGTKLTLDEAQTLYAVLGEQATTFNKQPCHVKAVVTQVHLELLKS